MTGTVKAPPFIIHWLYCSCHQAPLFYNVDNLLMVPITPQQRREDMLSILMLLYFVKLEVTFLGHLISKRKSDSYKRTGAIRQTPMTKKQLASLLGMCSYCWSFIPNYSERLRAMTSQEWSSGGKLHWTGLSAHSGHPWLYETIPCEKGGPRMSVLSQQHGDKLRAVVKCNIFLITTGSSGIRASCQVQRGWCMT